MILLDTNVLSELMRHEPEAHRGRNLRHFEGLGLSLVNPWSA